MELVTENYRACDVKGKKWVLCRMIHWSTIQKRCRKKGWYLLFVRLFFCLCNLTLIFRSISWITCKIIFDRIKVLIDFSVLILETLTKKYVLFINKVQNNFRQNQGSYRFFLFDFRNFDEKICSFHKKNRIPWKLYAGW